MSTNATKRFVRSPISLTLLLLALRVRKRGARGVFRALEQCGQVHGLRGRSITTKKRLWAGEQQKDPSMQYAEKP